MDSENNKKKIPHLYFLITMNQTQEKQVGKKSPQCHSGNWHGGWACKLSFSHPLPSVSPRISKAPQTSQTRHQLGTNCPNIRGYVMGKENSDPIMK